MPVPSPLPVPLPAPLPLPEPAPFPLPLPSPLPAPLPLPGLAPSAPTPLPIPQTFVPSLEALTQTVPFASSEPSPLSTQTTDTVATSYSLGGSQTYPQPSAFGSTNLNLSGFNAVFTLGPSTLPQAFGVVTVGGTLTLALDYLPQDGSQITLFTYAQLQGSYDSVVVTWDGCEVVTANPVENVQTSSGTYVYQVIWNVLTSLCTSDATRPVSFGAYLFSP